MREHSFGHMSLSRSFLSGSPVKSHLLLCFFSALFALGSSHGSAAQTWIADNGNGTYSNPFFYDEFADPDIIRVGSGFYLLGSSMHVMPGLAVLHSRDLVNWDFESYALDKLDLGPEYRLENGENVYGQGIWAPSFRYHDGVFYIFANVNGQTTQMFRSGNGIGPTPISKAIRSSLHRHRCSIQKRPATPGNPTPRQHCSMEPDCQPLPSGRTPGPALHRTSDHTDGGNKMQAVKSRIQQ
jgi:hypothetical protein